MATAAAVNLSLAAMAVALTADRPEGVRASFWLFSCVIGVCAVCHQGPNSDPLFLLRDGNSLQSQRWESCWQSLHTQTAKLSHSHCATEEICFLETNSSQTYSYRCATSPHHNCDTNCNLMLVLRSSNSGLPQGSSCHYKPATLCSSLSKQHVEKLVPAFSFHKD